LFTKLFSQNLSFVLHNLQPNFYNMSHQPAWQTPASPGIQGLQGAANLLKGIAAGIPASNLSTASWPTTLLSQPNLQQQQQQGATTVYQTSQPIAPQYYIQTHQAPASNDPQELQQHQQQHQPQAAQAPFTLTIQAPSPYAVSAPFAMTVPAPAPYTVPSPAPFTMMNGAQGYFVNGTMTNGTAETTTQQQQQVGPPTMMVSLAPAMQMTTNNGQTYYWMQPAATAAVQQTPQPQSQGGSAPSQAV
jgi:hypothetical protein